MMILELDIVKYRGPQAIWEDGVDLLGSFRLHGCYLLIGLND
jgi:hypothetical protein